MTAPGPAAKIRVLKPDYSGVIGTIPAYRSVSATWQRLGVGTATLNVGENRAGALAALTANQRVVPVVIEFPGYPRWSGRVEHVRATRRPRTPGDLEITLTSDWKWLHTILAAPVPGSVWTNQAGAEHDVRSGTLATIARQYLTANINRLSAELTALGMGTAPLAVRPGSGADTSPVLTLAARNVSLADLLVPPLRTYHHDLTVTLWLPGDPPVPGLSLSAATLVVDVVPTRDRPWVNFSDSTGGLRERVVTAHHPQALSTLVMGPGEGTARTFRKVWAEDSRIALLGRWGFPETNVNATDIDAADTNAFITRGLTDLAEHAGATSVAFEIDDERPWKAGPDGDYWVGDTTRVTFSGVTTTDTIERVTIAQTQAAGLTVTPQFGPVEESPDQQQARVVAALVRRLNLLEAEG